MVRFLIIALLSLLGFITIVAASFGPDGWWAVAVLAVLLLALGIHDVLQTKHAILRNYPVLGRMRFLFESIRPEIQQYFIERNTDGRPFDRDTRSLVYSRAKGADSHKAFGTERDVNEVGYEFLLHSTAPVAVATEQHRVRIGGPDCTQPYDMSLMNVSSMSFGALSQNAVLAMNKGAAMGGFAQETGEGGLSPYHLEYGADIFWEIGSGYFGCRDDDGNFDSEQFARKAANEHVKGITIKLSQGAKPGLGGVLPAAKITEEIAKTRGVPMGVDCISPASHSAFGTPRELMGFIAELRALAQGKPVGFKLCVGLRTDVLAMCKAMLETGITPDFITVDGSEGGTGAAPLEYEDHMGTPLTEGLMLMHNALVGCGLRHKIRLGAAGKVATGSDVVKRLIQGADFTFSARAMMMATGCIQAQKCHTNHCPVGVTTQDPRRYRALDVLDKGNRVHNYHKLTVQEAAQLMASMGVSSPEQLNTRMLRRRVDHLKTRSYAKLHNWLKPGQLLDKPPRGWAVDWQEADADTFGQYAPMPWPTPREPAAEVSGSVAPKRVEPKDSTHRTVAPVQTSAGRPEGRPAPKAAAKKG
ncbi:FMN-binding glutamate synthase family protein [Paeniglutamicibacter antarcticus]|uniref:FMN-binding glutamate synthase family protein n=1 Tax=Paeniglutamicibacter antarcticus TaxID=494023 RepID=A0ABP9TKF5_9MICC